MKNRIKERITSLKREIEEVEKQKKIGERFFYDPAVKNRWLLEKYEELGKLFIQTSEVKSAVEAFKKARDADIKFILSEFSYDKKIMQETLQERKKNWLKKINSLEK